MTMLEKAIAHMIARNDMYTFTLDDLRRAAGIALRSQYRLSELLAADPRVHRHGGRTFSLADNDQPANADGMERTEPHITF